MMRLISILILACVAFLFAEPKLSVAVTLAPYAKIVQEIAGENADVVTLVPPNANPHLFEPKPNTLRAFSKASLYLSDGSGLDKAWRPRFMGVNKNVRIVDISQGVSWMKGEVHEHEHDHEPPHGHAQHHAQEEHHAHEHGEELDPHIWNSPRMAIVIASNVCSALVELDSVHAGVYRTNLEKFSKRLSDLDVKFTEATKALSEDRRTFIVFHPSYGYLARDYGLKQIAVEMHGKEPKPRDMQKLVHIAKEHQVKTVFVQPQFSRRAAESLSREIQAKIVSIDPLAFDFEQELQKFISAISEGFK